MADDKAKVGPVKYVGQVRQEGRKVVWPTPRETVITTIMVLIVMVMFGIFFFFVDWLAANGTQVVLGIGSEPSAGPGAGG
jgi:preprotein translocase subunit SecE